MEETTGAVTGARGVAPAAHLSLRAMRKVPQITASFWIVKLLTTAMGESLSDYALINFAVPGLVFGAVGLIAALALQLSVRRYVPWVYWSTVGMVAIVGTMVADVPRFLLGISYLAAAVSCAVALAGIFAVWYARERTLSIHSIDSRSRELFYWATVMATFALGTAAGDLTADAFGWGYFPSAVLFAALMAVPVLGRRLLGLNGIVTFWFAYILTRPIGASFADWLGRDVDKGGVGLGAGPVGLCFALVAIGFVGYLTVTHKDRTGEQASTRTHRT